MAMTTGRSFLKNDTFCAISPVCLLELSAFTLWGPYDASGVVESNIVVPMLEHLIAFAANVLEIKRCYGKRKQK